MASRRGSQHDMAFVGRQPEWRVLRAALDALIAGRAGVARIRGGRGIGKTRLAEALGYDAAMRGVDVVWLRRGADAPYDPWRTLRDLCDRDDADTPPRLVIVDDADGVDSSALVGSSPGDAAPARRPLLVVVVGRDPGVPPELPLAVPGDTAAAVEVVLGGLDQLEVAALVGASLGSAAPADANAALHQLSDGNPALVGEFVRAVLVQARPAAGAPIDWEAVAPRALRAVVRAQLASLSRRCQALLAVAAVAGHDFEPAALCGAGRTSVAVEAGLREAAAAGIVVRAGGESRRAFAHALARDTLYDDLPPARRARLHREVAAGLRRDSGAPGVLAELAHHHFAAALLDGDPDDAERAADCAEQAARGAAATRSYSDAAHFYRLAINALGGRAERRRAGLWIELGEVLRLAGDEAAARAAFREAIAPARRFGQAELLARAALGMADRYMEVGAADEGLCALLAEALVRLPVRDSGLRTRVVARLAVELAYTRQPQRAVELSVEAAAMANRCGDPAALTYAFGAAYLTSQALNDPRQRLAMADQVLLHVEAAGDLASAAELCGWRVDALVELGDRPVLDAAVARHAAVAAQLSTPVHNWLTALFGAACALLDGDLAGAEPLAAEAAGLGQIAGDANASHAFAAQLFYLRSEQDRLEELRDVFAASVEEYPAMPGWASALSLLHSRAGRDAEVERILDRLAPDRFGVLPRDRLWLMTVALLGESCASLTRSPHAATLYELLLPFADRHVMITGGALSFGAAGRFLGLLAAAAGRWSDADRHLEIAFDMNTRLRAPLLMAHTQCDRASMLLRRGRGRDREPARALLDDARRIAAGRESPYLLRRLAELTDTGGTKPSPAPDRAKRSGLGVPA